MFKAKQLKEEQLQMKMEQDALAQKLKMDQDAAAQRMKLEQESLDMKMKMDQEAFELETEIAKARARQQVFDEDDGDLGIPAQATVKQESGFEYSMQDPLADSHKWNPDVKPFKPKLVEPPAHRLTATKINPVADQSSEHDKTRYITSNNDQQVVQQQNEMILKTQQQMATAMLLPHAEVPKFKDDPIEYATFIMAFDARIVPNTMNDSDRLYYLHQQLEGPSQDLIGGCMFMDPTEGYQAARQLLKEEYGDPYKVSMAYVKKLLSWPTIRHDDSPGLKVTGLFSCEV